MPSSSPIDENIRTALKARRKSLGRAKSDTNPYTSRSQEAKKNYLRDVQKTPYLYMLSTESIQEKRRNATKTKAAFDAREKKEKTGRLQKDDIKEDTDYLGGWAGPILLANTELSEKVGKKIKFGMDVYSPRGKKDRPYRPNAGIKGLSSEYHSSGQQAFIRKITVNWTCFTLEDLDILQERFMTLGRKVYVEWGVSSETLPEAPVFLTKDKLDNYKADPDFINDKEIKDENGKVIERISAAHKFKEKVLENNGSLDAILGYVDGYEFSQRDDGGFDCTTNLTVNGGNIFKIKKEKTPEPGELDEFGLIQTKDGFLDSLDKLPRILDQYIDTSLNQPAKTETIYEDYTTADSFESEVKTRGILIKEKYRETTIQDLTNKTSEYKYNDNAIIKVDTVRHLDESVGQSYGEFGLGSTLAQTFGFEGKTTEEAIEQHLSSEQKQQSGEGFWHIKDKAKKEIVPSECWVRWGWFEDNILNRYFALLSKEEEEVNIQKTFRSIKPIEKSIAGVPKDEEKDSRYVLRHKEKVVSMDGKNTAVHFRSETVWDKKSKTCKNHIDFKTPDINNFIFPGQFSLEDIGYDSALLEGQGKTLFESQEEKFDEEKAKGAKGGKKPTDEYNFTKNWEIYLKRYNGPENLSMMYGGPLTRVTSSIEDLQQELEDYKISAEDGNMTETGIVPYLELKILEKVVIAISKNRPFKTNEKTNDDGKITQDGLIRNIFVNVSKLQALFKTPGDNIESNMQLFVRSLEHESNGLFKFIIVEDEEGGSGFEDKNTTEEENQNLITWDEDGESIYEFPVHTHDSFVESQELSSDMGSSQQQMMMSKQFAAQSVTDSGGSVIAESIFNDIVDKEVIVSTDTTTTTAPQITTSVPSQMPGWESFGQIDGNEDLDFDRSGGASLKVPPTPEEIANEGKSSDEWNSNEKDAEQANAIFTSTNSEYDITGKLKNIKGMFDKVGTTKSTQTKITKDDGTTETYEIRQTTDETWGLLFITNTITMTGIAGIKPGDLWTTSYLPKKFKENAHFWTTNVSQTIDSSGWKTTLTGRVNFRLQKVQK